MKKLTKILLAMMLVIASLLTFTACFAPAPAKNLEKAEDALEDADYTVHYEDDSDSPYIKETLYASDDDDNTLSVRVFNDAKTAKIFYEQMKNELDYEKDEIKAEIKLYEHLIKKYEDDLDSDEIDEYEDDIKELKDELEELENLVVGRSGKTVWSGTKDAIKDSKK